MQGYRKEQLFHTKCRSGRDRESNPEPPAWQAASLDAQPSTTPFMQISFHEAFCNISYIFGGITSIRYFLAPRC
jgi:hypothetical protein